MSAKNVICAIRVPARVSTSSPYARAISLHGRFVGNLLDPFVVGGAIGIAIASSVAASHTQALLHAGGATPAALTGGFQHAFWVLGAIGLLAVPVIFGLVRRNELADAVPWRRSASRNPRSPR